MIDFLSFFFIRYTIGSCSASNKLTGCSFDSHSCDFVDVPFDDDHDFAVRSSGGQDGGGMY